MKFRTEVEIPNSTKKIEVEDSVFSIGSCFATEMSDLLKTGQIQAFNNPFGTLFNPFSINKAFKKLHHANYYEEGDLISYSEEFISLDHHSSFNSRFLHQTLDKINHEIEKGNQFLQNTNCVIITYGTSFIYEFLPKKNWSPTVIKFPENILKNVC